MGHLAVVSNWSWTPFKNKNNNSIPLIVQRSPVISNPPRKDEFSERKQTKNAKYIDTYLAIYIVDSSK